LIREEAVTGWLAGFGLRAPLTFTPLGAGKSNLVYAVTDVDGRRFVLRRPPVGPLAPSAHDVAREYRILAALGDEVPAPRALGLCVDPEVTDAPLMLLEHVDGLVLDDPSAAERTDGAWRAAAGPAMACALAAIHAVDLDATGLSGLAKHEAYAERQLRRWARQWDDLATREQPLVKELASTLGARIPLQQEVALVHGDYHLRNVIFDPADARVRAVVDWELCTLGDPLADLGGLLAYWPRPGDDPQVPRGLSILDGFAERDALVEAYADATGRDVTPVAFWQALAYWKIAIIIEGVRLRAAAGRTQGAVPYDAAFVDALLERARQTLVDSPERG
jgi:aminoglycoside phosphotransferase (APT) family kinase protein